ncbi:protein yippee-like isoform X2 [Anopheles merus]|uniref:protein yippee-like isoform X2 n=1 Tax=Anopheles merus TaxID=30066 RepID=UPI001BE420B1|nr:protein yippee-like isoform X2 [Anopheles merus]
MRITFLFDLLFQEQLGSWWLWSLWWWFWNSSKSLIGRSAPAIGGSVWCDWHRPLSVRPYRFASAPVTRTVSGTLESNQENDPTQEAANGGHANGQSSSASSSSSGSGTMVKTFQAYLPPTNRTYSCVHCRAHLASHDELISKSFQGSQGRAYLFNSVVNVACGQAEERVLLTGLHAVADIYCECCRTPLGWKYEHAFESSQKYKEGKYIIELAHMIKENGWD